MNGKCSVVVGFLSTPHPCSLQARPYRILFLWTIVELFPLAGTRSRSPGKLFSVPCVRQEPKSIGKVKPRKRGVPQWNANGGTHRTHARMCNYLAGKSFPVFFPSVFEVLRWSMVVFPQAKLGKQMRNMAKTGQHFHIAIYSHGF